MTPDPVFFKDLAYIFAAAVLGGSLAWLLRQPIILGYVIGGIVVSPLTPGPLRDAFVALFFVTVGALINPGAVLNHLDLLGVIVTLVVAGKLVIWTAVVWLFRQPFRTALLVGVGLTQIGEFSFILIRVARDAGHVGADVYNATLAASLLTILANAFLVRRVPLWLGVAGVSPAGREAGLSAQRTDAERHVVVCGVGRLGCAVAEALESFETPYVAIDVNPDVAEALVARGVHCLLGDASRRSTLQAAGVADATLVVVAIAEIDRAEQVVREVRMLNPAVPVLARAHGEPGA
jgi:CPA2 family monovalent cation:H+ antiporter-2